MPMVTKLCATCGEEFQHLARFTNQRFCSRSCSARARRAEWLQTKAIVLTCVECGGEFTRPPSVAGAGAAHCSWGCRRASGSHRFYGSPSVAIDYADCSNCGRLFVRRAKRANRYDRAFCDLVCRDAFNGTGVRLQPETWTVVSCMWCAAPFNQRLCRLRDGRGRYCSRRCAALGRPIDGKPSKIATDAIDEWCSRDDRPLHVREYRVDRWSIDLAFPVQMIALELDGDYWHSLPEMVERDQRKDVALNRAGWKVVRITMGRDDTPKTIADRIDAALRQEVRRRGRR